MLVSTLLLVAAQVSKPNDLTSPSGIFSNDDYPADALANHWEGDVAVSLRVDASGRPRACFIAQSSGHASLDQKTCEIMLVRARFHPALNSSGDAVEDIVPMTVIHWKLPR